MLSACIAVLVAPQAGAVTLDFSGLSGPSDVPLYVPGSSGPIGATITHASGGDIEVGDEAEGEAYDFCFASAFNNCADDGQIVFDSAISGLTFDVVGWHSGDSVNIEAWNGGVFLGFQNFPDSAYAVSYFRKGFSHGITDHISQLIKENLVKIQASTVPDCPAKDSAKNIIPVCITGLDSVCNGKSQSPYMVGNDPERYIDFLLRSLSGGSGFRHGARIFESTGLFQRIEQGTKDIGPIIRNGR